MKGNISTVRELLQTSPIVLMLLADIGMKEVNELIAMVSEKTCPNPQNGLMSMHARLQKKRHLSCGVDRFDAAMKGGLLVGSISEICGAPGAGKTQFCLSCTLQGVIAANQSATSSGATGETQQGGVIYIDTELKFDPNRLIQMAMERYPETYSSEFRTDAPHQIDRLLSQVKVSSQHRITESQRGTVCCMHYHILLFVTDVSAGEAAHDHEGAAGGAGVAADQRDLPKYIPSKAQPACCCCGACHSN
jgi:RecA/RadA recombinase